LSGVGGNEDVEAGPAEVACPVPEVLEELSEVAGGGLRVAGFPGVYVLGPELEA
jgi:hypothetical protein